MNVWTSCSDGEVPWQVASVPSLHDHVGDLGKFQRSAAVLCGPCPSSTDTHQHGILIENIASLMLHTNIMPFEMG